MELTGFCEISRTLLRSLGAPVSSCILKESIRSCVSSVTASTSSICSGMSMTEDVTGGGAIPLFRSLASSEILSHRSSRAFSRCSALFCCSLYSWEHSSKSCGFISMNIFIALYTMLWMVLRLNCQDPSGSTILGWCLLANLFQCSLEFSNSGGNIMGKIIAT